MGHVPVDTSLDQVVLNRRTAIGGALIAAIGIATLLLSRQSDDVADFRYPSSID